MDTQLITTNKLNARIKDVIHDECMGLVERSSEGQRLFALRATLTEAIQAKLGYDLVRDLDDLVGGLIVLYGDEMFDHGFTIGRDPAAALSLPDSEFDY